MKWLLLAVVLLALGFTEELYRYIFCSRSSWLFTKLFDSKGHLPAYYEYERMRNEKMKKIPCRTLTLQGRRGETLKGFFYDNGAQGQKIAFVVHGYRSNHQDTGGIVYDYYKSRGFDVFAPDHTAEGESGGHFIGFDVLESRDCHRWIDLLKKEYGEDIQIVLHGFSMGAATVMQMSSHCPANVKFIAEDSGYENAYSAMVHQVLFMYHPLRFINRILAGYDWNDSDVKESLANSRIPMLFFHGQDDKLVPYENGPKLYKLYERPKDCLFPEKTRHIECFYTSTRACARKLDSFMEKYID